MAKSRKISEAVLNELREKFGNMDLLISSYDFDREVLCKLIRKKYGDDIDLSDSIPNESSSFADYVRQEIKLIELAGKNKNVKNWGKSLHVMRTMTGTSLDTVAEYLGLKSHASVLEDEQISAEYTVELSRLEAYSLIYHVLPLELLQANEKAGTPLAEEQRDLKSSQAKKHNKKGEYMAALHPAAVILDPRAIACQNYIINRLYTPDVPHKIYALHAVAVIGVLDSSVLDQLRKDLQGHENYDFSEYFESTADFASVSNEGQDIGWLIKGAEELDYDQYDRWNYTCGYILREAQAVTDFLSQHDTQRLALLANIASMSIPGLITLTYQLGDGYYLRNNNQSINEKFLWNLDLQMNFKANGESENGDDMQLCLWNIRNVPAGAILEPRCLFPQLSLSTHLLRRSKNS